MFGLIVYGIYVRFSINPKTKRIIRRSKLNKIYPDNFTGSPLLTTKDSSKNPAGTLNQDFEKYLAGHLTYYDNLCKEKKIKFLERVQAFVNSKEFSGRGGLEVTDQMKTLVAATAIQLTFGLEKFSFDYFDNIIIYPEAYFSPVTGRKHKGEAHPLGAIVISWLDFLKGFSIPDDRLNLGLHEMAHALELENRIGEFGDEDFVTRSNKFKKVSAEEFQRLRDSKESFLRSYAGTNREEFFAVCVEHFFEAAKEFKKELPEVYKGLSDLLGQDPAAEGSC
jgi:Mlc titration factor MtfA (ptsG expression regulator)